MATAILFQLAQFLIGTAALIGTYALSLFLWKRVGRRVGFLRSVRGGTVLVLFVLVVVLLQYVLSGNTQFLEAVLFVMLTGIAYYVVAWVLWSKFAQEIG